MSQSDGNDEQELKTALEQIIEKKGRFSENEQTIIENWVRKLTEVSLDDTIYKTIRTEYAEKLAKITNEEGKLIPPFTKPPPSGHLRPLAEMLKQRFPEDFKKMPCAWSKKTTGAIPKTKKSIKTQSTDFKLNKYEDPEEMAKIIARSKGQSFPDFVLSIARHTSDYGQAMQKAMKTELTSFRDYVDNVLSQRVKDLTEVLDEEQNRELQKIQKDVNKWQTELGLVKRKIKELIPDFDIEAYKNDPDYLKKIIAIEPPLAPDDDPFKKWKEETSHRLKWIHEMTCKISRCNEQTLQDITDINCSIQDVDVTEAMKQQNHMKFIEREISEYEKLKCERDQLQTEHKQLLMEIKKMECE